MGWHGMADAMHPSLHPALSSAVATRCGGGLSAPSIFPAVNRTRHDICFPNNNAIGSVFSYELIYEVIIRILQAMICAGIGTVLYKERETTLPYPLGTSCNYLIETWQIPGWFGPNICTVSNIPRIDP